MIAVREVDNPQAYLALFELKFTSEADLNVLDTILPTVVFY